VRTLAPIPVARVDSAPARPRRSSLLGDLLVSTPPPPPPAPPTEPPSRPVGGARRWPLGYVQRGQRDPRFDLLRGFCLLVMVVNGLGGNSWLNTLTGSGRFYISAAEGFVFIAGYVLGLNAACDVLAVTVRLLVRRAWTLYRLTVGITLVASLLAASGRLRLWYPLPDAIATVYAGRPDAFLLGTLTLAVAYHGGEVLVLFLLLLLAAPLALLACAEGKGWLVPLVSVGIYLTAQLYSDQFRWPFATYFSPPAWQLLFFVGLAIGYHRRWLGEQIARRRPLAWAYATLVVAAALGLLVLYVQGHPPRLLLDRENVEAARVALTPRRLLPVAIYLQFFAFLATWFWLPLRAAFGWFILSLGRDSLWIFTLHLPLIVLFRNVPALDTADRTVGTLAQIVAIALLWGSLRVREWARGSAYRGALPASRTFRRLARR